MPFIAVSDYHKHDFPLEQVDVTDIIDSKDCILLLLGFMYFSSLNDRPSVKRLKDHAKQLAHDEEDFNRNWLFVYEVLPQSFLKDDWKAMKKAKVSFIAEGFRSKIITNKGKRDSGGTSFR